MARSASAIAAEKPTIGRPALRTSSADVRLKLDDAAPALRDHVLDHAGDQAADQLMGVAAGLQARMLGRDLAQDLVEQRQAGSSSIRNISARRPSSMSWAS